MSASDTGRAPNNFALLRLATALLVIYGHAFAVTGTPTGEIFGMPVDYLRLKAFFAISGYLVCLSWLRDPHVLRFAHRRALRILPPFIVCILITAYVIGPLLTTLPLEEYFSGERFRRYHWNLLFWINYILPGVFTDNTYGPAVNGSIWMMPIEISLYLVLPLAAVIATAWQRRGMLLIAALLAVSLYLSSGDTFMTNLYSLNIRQWLVFAPYFFAGALIAIGLGERKIPWYAGAAAILLMAFVHWPRTIAEPLFVFLIPLVWISIGQTRALFPGLVSKVGDLSYGVFLYSFIIQQTLVHFGIFPDSVMANFLIASALAMVAGWISWHGLEKHLMRFRPRRRDTAALPPQSHQKPVPDMPPM
jgi:peptidoglycan/LPS O-acetylase OafA/YrhL